ncbi:MAG TPA: efflux RND transporter permease subunit [Steroidobacteraceae bacterium]|nr:efflux RND transporter permease subunit [Steroidobacteraceae bacterium]
MNFVTWAIRNPVPAVMIFVVLTIGGILGFRALDIQDRPDITFPMVVISESYAGAPPDQLETEVTRKIEDAVANVVGIQHITSNIVEGGTDIQVEFQLGTDLSQAVDDIRDAVTRIRPNLPADALEPVISRITTSGNPIMTVGVSSKNMTDTELSWFVDQTVMREMSAVAGVGKVSRIGGVDREVLVSLDPDRMAALGATASDISQQLKRIQAEQPAGTARVGGLEQNVRAVGTVATAQQLAELPILLSDGRSVRLDAVADVLDQSAEVRQIELYDGKPMVAFSITRAWGAGVAETAKGAEAALAELRRDYPQVTFNVVDDTEVTQVVDSYRSSMEMLFEGALLAIVVVWLFLRDWRATFISAAALPLAIIPTFWGMHLLGYTLNLLTLLALSLVVGMLVDDAIVEVENIVRHLRMGKPPLQAAKDAAIEIGLAVVATTLSLCAVFLPVAFMNGIPGAFFRPFGFTAAVAVLCSLLVARLLTPTMAAYWMRPHEEVKAEGPWLRRYLRWAEWCLDHRWRTLAVATVLFVGSISMVMFLPTGFSPGGDSGSSNITMELAPGTALADTLRMAEAARKRVAAFPETSHITTTVGDGTDVRTANINILWKPRSERKATQLELQARAVAALRDLPGVRLSTRGQSGGQVQFALVGSDSVALATAAAAVADALSATPGFSAVHTSASLLQPEIVIRPLPDRAAELGVTTASISQAIRFATSGDVDLGLAKLNLPDRQIPIRVRLSDSARNDINRIRLLPVPGRNGVVPLVNVADISFGTAPAAISRYDRNRNITITADLDKLSLGQALTKIDSLPVIQNLPPGVHRSDAGEAQFFREMMTGFLTAMAIGVLCIYALLVLLFHDFIQPLTILSALPPSAGGAIVALLVGGFQLSIPAMIGMLTLMGIVTKNSILLVEYAVMARRDHGLSRHEALLDACGKRVRPIVMTTIAMGAGMMPIALGLSGDSSFRSPMGVAVIGGLVASTVLSLFVVPCAFTVLDDFRLWAGRLLTRRQPLGEAAETAPR